MNIEKEAIRDYIEENVILQELLDTFDISYRQSTPTRLKFCCPFHEEKTPSFIVYLDKNKFRCFGGCGVSGGPIKFLMLYHKKSFNEVLEMFKDKVGSGEALVFEKLNKSLETKKTDFTKYINSRKYGLGIFLRNILYKNPDKWDMVEKLHVDMDNFFSNELEKKEVDKFSDSIMERALEK